MPREKKQSSFLKPKDYSIAGNDIRAFYDRRGKLVFVIDSTMNDKKSNVLLVINPVGNRKWDDILENDYAVDLETVRPKKNNKYQKLDIEYGGLAKYDNLITLYNRGKSLSGALRDLSLFRIKSVRQAAEERLNLAKIVVKKTRETISKTQDSITELNEKLENLNKKLKAQKRQIGKEPTKQSASKILRTEAQIDDTGEKLNRAKKRLFNADRKLTIAQNNIRDARKILAKTELPVVEKKQKRVIKKTNLPVKSKPKKLIVKRAARVPARIKNNLPKELENDFDQKSDEDFAENAPKMQGDELPTFNNVEMDSENMIKSEPKVENVAKKDGVKPLFDKDPKITDEENAFKPIDFGESDSIEDEDRLDEDGFDTYDDKDDKDKKNNTDSGDANLTFTPPNPQNKTSAKKPLEIHPIPGVPKGPENPTFSEGMMNAANSQGDSFKFEAKPIQRPASIRPSLESETMPKAAPDIAPAPVSSNLRPVSPVSNNNNPTDKNNMSGHRSTNVVYYVLLIILIALSIITLWAYQRYQKHSAGNAPDITTVVKSPAPISEKPVQSKPPVEEVKITEPENINPEPEPVAPEPVAPSQPIEVAEEPAVVESPFLSDVLEEEPKKEKKIVLPMAVNKPAYNVPQHQKMIVTPSEADIKNQQKQFRREEYEQRQYEQQLYNSPSPQEKIVQPVYNTTVEQVKPQYSKPQSVKKPSPPINQMYVTSEEFEVKNGQSEGTQSGCLDGSAPDRNGCCPGEIYTNMGSQGFNCCPASGGDCFPPLL